MNTFKKLLCGVAALAMLTACGNEEIDGPKGGSDVKEGDFFTTLTLSVPVTRSSTIGWTGNTNSNDGYEIGQTPENTVGSVIIVLATSDPNNLAPNGYTYLTSNNATPVSAGTVNGQVAYQVTFESQKLVESAGKQVCVFAICNPTEELSVDPSIIFKGNGNDNDGTGKNNLAAISTENKFLMTNFSLTKIVLPSVEDLQSTYNTEANPFNLGIVEVERVVSRFDFKQKAAETVEGVNLGANQYPIMVGATPEVPYQPERWEDMIGEDGKPVIDPETGKTLQIHYPEVPAQPAIPAHIAGYVELDGMAAFNIANEYYYLPRVGGADFSNVITCGTETAANWVVSPNYTQKIADPLDLSWVRTAYSDNMLGEESIQFVPSELTFTEMSELAKDDNDENWGPNNSGIPGYKIWRYVTENTIPGVSNQRHGISTGVCFRAHLAPVANEGIDDALTNLIIEGQKVLYSCGNELVGDMEILRKKVAADPTSALAVAYREALEKAMTLDPDFIEGSDFTITTPNGLKILRPTDGKYYMYYYYYNRHFDNGEPTNMRGMEFATVRNNVYKLAVDEINRFGHTANPGDDPDPEEPGTPDEEPKTYFRVQVRVLPWVVRINNIKL